MSKFQVTINGTFRLMVDVEAESRDEAIEQAQNELPKDLDTEVEEIDVDEIK